MKPTNEQVKLASGIKQAVLTLWDAIAELLVAHDKEVRERAIEDAALLADARFLCHWQQNPRPERLKMIGRLAAIAAREVNNVP